MKGSTETESRRTYFKEDDPKAGFYGQVPHYGTMRNRKEEIKRAENEEKKMKDVFHRAWLRAYLVAWKESSSLESLLKIVTLDK